MTTNEGCELPPGCPIIFDDILTKNSRDICCYEHEGMIEIRKVGTYMIDWDVMISDSSGECASFALEVDDQIQSCSTLPLKVGQVVGQALIEVDQVPACIRLINNTGCDVQLSKFSPVANLRIVTVE